MVRARASKDGFPRASTVWLSDCRYWDLLGHLESNLRSIWRARISRENTLELVTNLGSHNYM